VSSHASAIVLRGNTRSSAIADRPARRYVSVEMLAYCCRITQTDPHVNLNSTVSNCHVRFIPLPALFCTRSRIVAVDVTIAQRACNAVRVINRLPCTTNLVDVNWTVTAIIRFRLLPELLMTPHISPPVHRRGRGRPWRMDTNYRR